MKNLLLTLIAICFLFVGVFNTFSQTSKSSSKKLVKCYEKGKVVYRTKCKTKKSQTVSQKSEPEKKYGDPNSKFEIVTEQPGTGGGMGSGRGTGVGSGSGIGSGGGSNMTSQAPQPVKSKHSTLMIISKPKAVYTEEARSNQVEGTITLRVTFLANGTIGAISPVSGLPNGLTQQAINAAKLIKFTPQTKDGKPVTVTKQIQYNFTLY